MEEPDISLSIMNSKTKAFTLHVMQVILARNMVARSIDIEMILYVCILNM